MRPNAQLPLALGWRDGASFENFFADGGDEALPAARRIAEAGSFGRFSSLFLWGPPGVGKSHLLHAACRAAAGDGRSAGLVSTTAHGMAPLALQGLGELDLVCLDDAGSVAGHVAWERALFGLFNELEARGGRLLIASSDPPSGCGFSLPDLASRLSAGLVIRLRVLGDDARRALLRAGAAARGFALPEEVVDYVLARVPRDPATLVALLERLDAATLAERRRVTIPFMRKLLDDA